MPLSGRAHAFVLLAVVGALVILGLVVPWDVWVKALRGWFTDLAAWGPVVFVGVYVVATVLLFPGTPLTILSGAMFGVTLGSILVFVAATTGATISFLAARGMLRARVLRWIVRHPRLLGVDRAIAERGWVVAVLLRFSPIVPFNVLNYALGVTSLSLLASILACFAMIPATVMFASLGRAGEEAVAGSLSTERAIMIGVALVATVLASIWIARASRVETGAVAPPPPG